MQLHRGGTTFVPTLHYVAQQPIIQWLVIPGRARFLKEFFDVQLIIQNLAAPGFTFTHGSATLRLPAGLSLAPTSTPQSETQDTPDVAGGQSASVTWTVRGDAEGDYGLTADYAALLEPIDKPVALTAATSTPLKVWGGSALTMTVTVDSCAIRYGPYHVDVTLENVSDIPVYNPGVELLDQPADAPPLQAQYSLAPTTSTTTA